MLDEVFNQHPPHIGQHPTIPIFTNGNQLHLMPLLPTEDGLLCALCGRGYLTDNTLASHFSKAHPGYSPAAHSQATQLQKLYHNGKRAWIPVKQDMPDLDVGEAEDGRELIHLVMQDLTAQKPSTESLEDLKGREVQGL